MPEYTFKRAVVQHGEGSIAIVIPASTTDLKIGDVVEVKIKRWGSIQ